jgi:hypothetical protein
MEYKRPEQLPKSLRREIWQPPVRRAPTDLALPKVDGAVAGRFRTEREAVAPATPDVLAPPPVAPRPPAPTPTPVRLMIVPADAPAPVASALPVAPVVVPVTQAISDTQMVSIQINLPKLKLAPVKRAITAVGQGVGRVPRVYYRRLALAAAVVAVLMVSGVVGLKVKGHLADAAATKAAKSVALKAATANAKPSFTPLAPADSKNAAANGTPQVAYDGKRNTYSFTDTVQGQAIVVSQQPIPSQYKSAAAAVADVAAKLSAKTGVATSAGTAFIASDAKSNSQQLVFTKNNLLVFIQSPFSHSSDLWKAYINNLQTQ